MFPYFILPDTRIYTHAILVATYEDADIFNSCPI